MGGGILATQIGLDLHDATHQKTLAVLADQQTAQQLGSQPRRLAFVEGPGEW
jgi:hypothetical protein